MLEETNPANPTTVGELKLSDLPPVPELTITVPKDKLIRVGSVLSIVDVQVVVQSIKFAPPLDIDSVLFKGDGSPIGPVFDVFGAITEPHYSVRFNHPDDIKQKGIELEAPIFFTRDIGPDMTKFASIDELRKNKGTDASWENDNEPPPSAQDYSDDEEERIARRKRKSESV